ncbi:MAG: transglutaminase-like domain-containing protein [Pseudomonadota bacterium]
MEIALLRAAGIPARYVYGTIQLPVDNVMNWVGGVSTPEAAQSLLGQGGIPNVGVLSGGKVASIRMEHVWVEAWVDYIPSRGAVNKVGDSWIPLDASYKQYTYTQGMDIQGNVPLDANHLLDQIKQGASVNESEGWVQNLNSANIQSALTTYQNQVKTYIDSTKPNATVGDVLGSKTIVPQSPSILMGTLPYKTLATGAKLQSLPDNLKWQFRTDVEDPYGNVLAALGQNTPALAGKKLTISFIPAAQADLDLINSYLPQPHPDGSPIQPSELPSSLPGYLIHLKAEIRVDGQLISQSASAVTMGDTLTQRTAYYNPGSQQWEEGEPNAPIAGEYHAIALDLQGISARQLSALKTTLEQTQAKLEQFQANPNDPTPIQNLTKEDLSGDLLYSGILGYFASVDGSDQLTARANGDIIAYRLPSYGSFSATAQPQYWYGIVRSVSFPGVMMDVDRLAMHVEAKDGDKQQKLAYMKQVGAASSAFEHAVPERLFADPSKPLDDPSQPQGVSAVKAIAIAASQGQKIYTLTAHNAAYHANILASLNTNENTKTEIRNALSAGMEVTVHQADITVNGWTGSGYIILDPETGAGAYKISGGANGAYLFGVLFGFLSALGVLMMGFAFVVSGVVLAMTLILLGGMLITFVTESILEINNGCLSNGFFTGLGLGLAIVGTAATILATLIGVLFIGVSTETSTTVKNQC